MTDPTIIAPEDQIVARDVSPDVYMRHFAADFYEYVKGNVIKLPPVSDIHMKLTRFLSNWFEMYLEHRPQAELLEAPFVMNIGSRREPDLCILRHENRDRLKATYLDGAADLVVEIVSPESTERDYGIKFVEYESAGVREYWIIDPARREASFYILTDEKLYSRRQPDSDGIYTSTVLSELRLPVDLLWQSPLPGLSAVAQRMSELMG